MRQMNITTFEALSPRRKNRDKAKYAKEERENTCLLCANLKQYDSNYCARCEILGLMENMDFEGPPSRVTTKWCLQSMIEFREREITTFHTDDDWKPAYMKNQHSKVAYDRLRADGLAYPIAAWLALGTVHLFVRALWLVPFALMCLSVFMFLYWLLS